MLSQINIERQSVIQRGNLTIDPQRCTVLMFGEKINSYPKKFGVFILFTQYPGWVLSLELNYETVWKESVAGFLWRSVDGKNINRHIS